MSNDVIFEERPMGEEVPVYEATVKSVGYCRPTEAPGFAVWFIVDNSDVVIGLNVPETRKLVRFLDACLERYAREGN